MIKHLLLLLFIGLAWGQEDLLIKKAERSIKFKNGQKLIIRYTNLESNEVFITEGEFKSVDNDFLMISNENVIAEKMVQSRASCRRLEIASRLKWFRLCRGKIRISGALVPSHTAHTRSPHATVIGQQRG